MERIRSDPDSTNLVVLSGRKVVSATRRFRRGGEAWRNNPWAEITEEDHDALLSREGLPWTSHYQRERTPIWIRSGKLTAVRTHPRYGEPSSSLEERGSERVVDEA